MDNLQELGKQLTEQANDQLTNLEAIKGKGFATMVMEFLQMRSMGTIIAYAVNSEQPIGTLALATLSELQARYMTLVQEKLGVPTEEITEVTEWADRIHDSTKRTVQTALATQGGSDSLH